jgi:hypothetical protein
MDSSFNVIDNFDNFDNFDTDEIRPPDQIKKEQLMEDTRSEYDREIEEAIYLSMQEVRDQEILNEKFEEEIINKYINGRNERREKFSDLLINMNKLFKFDKDIKELYNFLEPIIEAYCNYYIVNYEVDEKTYDKIFQVLGTIRINKNTLDILKEIIVKNT